MTAAKANPERPTRALIVEDDPHGARLLEALLTKAGFDEISIAHDGVKGLAALEVQVPDLLVLDIMMPNMDGLEVLARVRADPRWAELPVLVQTAMQTHDDRAEIFKAGATDLVSKPLNAPEFIARARIHLENRRLLTQLSAFQARLQRDLSVARQMQHDLLPPAHVLTKLADETGLAVAGVLETSDELGGDFWGVRRMGNGLTALYAVDFSGHGVVAAVNTFRLDALIRNEPPHPRDPGGYLDCLNEALHDLLPPEQFATMFIAIHDPAAGELRYAVAGGPSPILVGSDGQASALCQGTLPLGISPSVRYQTQTTPFAAGDQLVLFSDALSETPGLDGSLLEESGVAALVAEVAGQAAPLDALLAAFRARCPGPVGDDLTVVWVKAGS